MSQVLTFFPHSSFVILTVNIFEMCSGIKKVSTNATGMEWTALLSIASLIFFVTPTLATKQVKIKDSTTNYLDLYHRYSDCPKQSADYLPGSMASEKESHSLIITIFVGLILIILYVSYLWIKTRKALRPLKKKIVDLESKVWKLSFAYEGLDQDFNDLTITYKDLVQLESQNRMSFHTKAEQFLVEREALYSQLTELLVQQCEFVKGLALAHENSSAKTQTSTISRRQLLEIEGTDDKAEDESIPSPKVMDGNHDLLWDDSASSVSESSNSAISDNTRYDLESLDESREVEFDNGDFSEEAVKPTSDRITPECSPGQTDILTPTKSKKNQFFTHVIGKPDFTEGTQDRLEESTDCKVLYENECRNLKAIQKKADRYKTQRDEVRGKYSRFMDFLSQYEMWTSSRNIQTDGMASSYGVFYPCTPPSADSGDKSRWYPINGKWFSSSDSSSESESESVELSEGEIPTANPLCPDKEGMFDSDSGSDSTDVQGFSHLYNFVNQWNHGNVDRLRDDSASSNAPNRSARAKRSKRSHSNKTQRVRKRVEFGGGDTSDSVAGNSAKRRSRKSGSPKDVKKEKKGFGRTLRSLLSSVVCCCNPKTSGPKSKSKSKVVGRESLKPP